MGLFEETLENVNLLGIDAEVNKQTKSADEDSLTWKDLVAIIMLFKLDRN